LCTHLEIWSLAFVSAATNILRGLSVDSSGQP
jgi:hypothetical protein